MILVKIFAIIYSHLLRELAFFMIKLNFSIFTLTLSKLYYTGSQAQVFKNIQPFQTNWHYSHLFYFRSYKIYQTTKFVKSSSSFTSFLLQRHIACRPTVSLSFWGGRSMSLLLVVCCFWQFWRFCCLSFYANDGSICFFFFLSM